MLVFGQFAAGFKRGPPAGTFLGRAGQADCRRLGGRQAQVDRLDEQAVAQHQGTLQGVFQLAHVARPGVLQQRLAGAFGEQLVGVFMGGAALNEAARQRQDVLAAFAQRRNVQRQHVQAIEQVFAEAPLGDFFAQIAVGGGDDAHVQLDVATPAQAFHPAFLQHAQQLGLQAERQLADLVEQQGAAVGQFELARLAVHRAGESTALVAEQQGFEHRLGDRRAVHRDEGRLGGRAEAVDVAGHQLLAGAGFAADQHRHAGQRHALGHGQQAPAGGRLADQALAGQSGLGMALQQGANLGGAERRQQIVDAAQLEQARRHRLVGVLDDGHHMQALAADQRQQLQLQRGNFQIAEEEKEDVQPGLAHHGRCRRLGEMFDGAAGHLQLLQQQCIAVIVPTADHADRRRSYFSGCWSLIEVMHIPIQASHVSGTYNDYHPFRAIRPTAKSGLPRRQLVHKYLAGHGCILRSECGTLAASRHCAQYRTRLIPSAAIKINETGAFDLF